MYRPDPAEEGVQKRNGSFTDSDIRRMIRNPVNKGTVS